MPWRKRHKRHPVLDPKMESVLVRLLSEVGELSKTQAVKLPYLVDVVAFKVLGHRITEGKYEPWQYGVVATEVYDLITDARHGGEALDDTPFEVEEPRGYEDRQILRLAKGSNGAEALTDEEREIVEFVGIQYAHMSPSDLGELTKEMNPHVKNWPSGRTVHVDARAYEHLPVEWDAVDAEIALQRMKESEDDPGSLLSGPELDAELDKIFQ